MMLLKHCHAYLHSNRIVHCNLSSNKVLLTENALEAMICNLGSATILAINPSIQEPLNCSPRHSSIYASRSYDERTHAKYNEKLDIFSFGVLTIEILTRLYLEPDSRQKHIIQKIVSEHPLQKTTALDCLEIKARL